MVLTTILLAAAALDLTEGERRQLATARDFGPLLDEAALYPLLKNAAGWRGGDETGAAVPDYVRIRRDPADHRGRIYLIEGRLIRSLGAPDFARPGPWEGHWQQWNIQWGTRPEDMTIVYLLDPPHTTGTTLKVRLPARFYKIWRDTDQNGAQTDYLVFVGQSARVLPVSGANPVRAVLFISAALVLLVVYLFLRRKTVLLQPRHQPLATRRLDIREERAASDEPSTTTLPADPAKALEELGRRGQESK